MKSYWILCLLILSCCGEPPKTVSPSSGSGSIRRAGLQLIPDPGWIEQAPENNMRAAQWVLPPADGAAPGTLVLFFFGAGGGGSVEDNFQRWCGQVAQPDGRSSAEVAVRNVERRDGLTIHTIAVGGRYVGETTPGSGERLDHSDWQLRGAIAEGLGGPWFIKLLGPTATVARWAESYDRLVSSLEL